MMTRSAVLTLSMYRYLSDPYDEGDCRRYDYRYSDYVVGGSQQE